MGIVLSEMIPEKRKEIMASAWDYGYNRMVGGVHYASNVEMGRISGTVIAQTIATHPDYQVEFAQTKKELRSVLGL